LKNYEDIIEMKDGLVRANGRIDLKDSHIQWMKIIMMNYSPLI